MDARQLVRIWIQNPLSAPTEREPNLAASANAAGSGRCSHTRGRRRTAGKLSFLWSPVPRRPRVVARWGAERQGFMDLLAIARNGMFEILPENKNKQRDN
ncbi:hypothetical protein EJB05_38459, partial [Eragrostis curvula]